MFMFAKIEEIVNRRNQLGLSQHQLSLQAGLGGSAINRIEREETIRVHHLRADAIAKTLKCKVSDVFNKEMKI